eukprot:CAMPEP_0174876618 /NCGR_PEP_ID=MMETSP1114-20130205/80430_1 /TAXON_ID=312471 /ORGANISM="Neobodo designis, Strain CCAP 1951/1" /LENGTH=358 /DNA_ID=CAMNT_0016111993 /DNA_START=48 /DNA_END=1124 /DNA_ORIENTATION=+
MAHRERVQWAQSAPVGTNPDDGANRPGVGKVKNNTDRSKDPAPTPSTNTRLATPAANTRRVTPPTDTPPRATAADSHLPRGLHRDDTDGLKLLDLLAGEFDLQLIYFLALGKVPAESLPASVILAEASRKKAFVGLHDLAGVRVVPLKPSKPPPQDTPEHEAWKYSPGPPEAIAVCERTYVFVGQFPSWMDATTLRGIFKAATGVLPRRVDRLPNKGAKVFLRTQDEVQRAIRFNQTVQIREFDVIFCDSRDHLLQMRRAIDQHLKGRVTRNPVLFLHAADVQKRQSGQQQAQQPLVRVGDDDRNGLYPMTIEEGTLGTKKPKATKPKARRDLAADATRTPYRRNPYSVTLIKVPVEQ